MATKEIGIESSLRHVPYGKTVSGIIGSISSPFATPNYHIFVRRRGGGEMILLREENGGKGGEPQTQHRTKFLIYKWSGSDYRTKPWLARLMCTRKRILSSPQLRRQASWRAVSRVENREAPNVGSPLCSALLQRGVCSIERTRLQAWHSMWLKPELFAVGCDCTQIVASFCTKDDGNQKHRDERDRAPRRNLIVSSGDPTSSTQSLSKGPVTLRARERASDSESIASYNSVFGDGRPRNDKQETTIRGELISVREERRNTARLKRARGSLTAHAVPLTIPHAAYGKKYATSTERTLSGRRRSRFKSVVAAADSASLPTGSTIFERCLSGLDQIYSYEFQKALDSSPKRSLLAATAAAAAPRNVAPKIRVPAVGLLVGAFVRSFGCRDILGDVPELSDDWG
ncbi:hypothetical protein DBV15_08919 [Temnothorax longispinosus]|uniref:Uncharacterized protein n=1 Tax=Temnothorax longispinosus TaxID=300112 RepID=A0A4V3S9U2_9HYME|nr:hypothetical protein DBV15_08919 [Temnothorax longispinosus]